MNTNLQELRKEAYRLWGIKPRQVIYNMPSNRSRPAQNNFTFKIDFSDHLKEWPKSYALALPDLEVIDRVIVPVKVFNRFGDAEVITPAWYDMPLALNNKIIELLDGQQFFRPGSKWKKWVNCFLPKRLRLQDKIKPEEYTYRVTLKNGQRFTIELV